jgi:hypothetical protein
MKFIFLPRVYTMKFVISLIDIDLYKKKTDKTRSVALEIIT